MGQIYELEFALGVVQIVRAAFLRANQPHAQSASGAVRHRGRTAQPTEKGTLLRALFCCDVCPI